MIQNEHEDKKVVDIDIGRKKAEVKKELERLYFAEESDKIDDYRRQVTEVEKLITCKIFDEVHRAVKKEIKQAEETRTERISKEEVIKIMRNIIDTTRTDSLERKDALDLLFENLRKSGQIILKRDKKPYDNLFKSLICEKINNRRFNDPNISDYFSKCTSKGKKLQKYDCNPYYCDDDSVYNVLSTEEGDKVVKILNHPMLITQKIRNVQNQSYRYKIVYKNNGRWTSRIVEAETLTDIKNIGVLAKFGLDINSENKKDVVRYCVALMRNNSNESDPGAEDNRIPTILGTSKLGWINNECVPYTDKYECDAAHDYEAIYKSIKSSGDAETLISLIKKARENKTIRLITSSALASLTLEAVDHSGFVVDIQGGTDVGKSYALNGICTAMFGEPWGSFAGSMNSTPVGLERRMNFLGNFPFLADESEHIQGRDKERIINDFIFAVEQGKTKGRGTKDGGVEDVLTWKLIALVTGENKFSVGNIGGGAMNRLIELEMTKSIQTVVGDTNEYAESLKANYGHLGREWAKYIRENWNSIRARFKEVYKRLRSEIGETNDKQLRMLAVILTTDEIVAELFFDEELLAHNDYCGILKTFSEVSKGERAFSELRGIIAANSSHFEYSSDKTIDIWGKVDGSICLINKTKAIELLKSHGYTLETYLTEWAEKGHLIKTGGAKPKTSHRTKIAGTLVKDNYLKLNFHEREDDTFTANSETLTDEKELPFEPNQTIKKRPEDETTDAGQNIL